MEKKVFFKKNMLFLLFALCIFHIYAAEVGKITVRGIVTDINENPLIGVTVKMENSSVGTTSDLDGKFVLDNVPSDSYIVFSYVGMESLRLKVSSELMKVVMKENAVALSEVVAVGYATMHKEDLTSAISKVDEKMFNNGITNSPINLLTGKVSGLVVRNVSGSAPNATPEIQLRGVGSIRAGSTPLIIIDGVYSTMTDLNSLNTTDIKSFNVLKDASSAAIYGTRGSNGVIIVETKDAEQGKTSIEYSSYYFTETPAKKLEVMDADEYLGFLKEKGLSVVNNDYGFFTDWTDELIRNNFGTYQGLSLATNNKNSELRVSLGYKKFDSGTGALKDPGYFAFTIIDCFFDFYDLEKDKKWLDKAYLCVDYIHNKLCDMNSRYPEWWDGRDELPLKEYDLRFGTVATYIFMRAANYFNNMQN